MRPTRMGTSVSGTSPTRVVRTPALPAGSPIPVSTATRRGPPRGRAVSRSGGRLGQVVHGCAVDRGGGEALLHPLRDLAGGCVDAPAECSAGSDEVVDAALGDVLFELREARGGIGAVEAPDRHDRIVRRQLVPGR